MNNEVEEIEALLPWYAAGALSNAERAQVEAALAARPELRASLATIEEDLGETVAANEALGAPSPKVWARIAQGVAAAPRKPSLSARIGGWFGLAAPARSPWLALAGVTAALVIALQATAIVGLLRSGAEKPAYGTVTAPPREAKGADVLVVFAPDAKFDDVTAFLKAQAATIVAGPKAGGLYELRVGDKALTKPELDALLKAMSAAPIVKMALPGG